MATIDNLMAGKQPGEIKVRYFTWPKEKWFQPYFKTDQWYGVNQSGMHDSWAGGCSHWQLWQEPVEEVEVFEWMYESESLDQQKNWALCFVLMTEKDAKKLYTNGKYRKTGRSWKVPR